MTDIGARKDDHLSLCAIEDVGFHGTTTLLDEVSLVHDPLPELALSEVNMRCALLGKQLEAPLLISAMTGGTEKAGTINRDLATIAEALGIGFALGSQRPMLEDSSLDGTYAVRDEAPTTLVVGNLGLWQARQNGADVTDALLERVGADALAVHLNPAQELVQAEGDRDFRGGRETLSTLVSMSSFPIVVKETGCGLGPAAATTMHEAGVKHLDVAGAGGTSWMAVERLRAKDHDERSLGEELREWGVPTAAAVVFGVRGGFSTVIASGGIASGLDAARAIALGASAVGIARPVLRAYWADGVDGARRYLEDVISSLRAIMLLTGSSSLADLRRAPRVIGPRLSAWLELESSTTPSRPGGVGESA